jgi:glycine/D-amino acid oxidase-like deaminating enzyme
MHQGLADVEGLELNVIVVMPTAYSKKEIPREICDLETTDVFEGSDALIADMAANKSTARARVMLMDGAFIDVLAEARAIAGKEGWTMVDQHYDRNAMDGHKSTATEIMLQCPEVTDVVCATGTGATAAGLLKYLPSHVVVHSRPAVSGSIDGLSNVERYGNFCDVNKLEGYREGAFEMDDALVEHKGLKSRHSVVGGPSMGATFWLAKDVLKKKKDAKVVFICADGRLELKRNPRAKFEATLQAPQTAATSTVYGTGVNETPSIETTPLKKRHGGVPLDGRESYHGPNNSRILGTPINYGTAYSNVRALSGFRKTDTSRFFSSMGRRSFSSSPAAKEAEVEIKEFDTIIVGGGPVGASTAWHVSEHEKNEGKTTLCIHDPANKGAHEDWSRLARLSFDGPQDEFDLSKHAISLLDMADEVRSYQSGAPVVPMRPGMLFVATPGTSLARACANGEANFGDEDFKRRDPSELEGLYPGNTFNLPPGTLCWTHPTGLCVSPLELASVARGVSQSYGVEFKEGRASVELAPEGFGKNMLRVTLTTGEIYHTRKCYLMAGAQSKKILSDAIDKDPRNEALRIPEFDDTYITAISTVRYKHRNHPARPVEGSGHVAPPITLGQIDAPDLIGFQANFSVVAEEYGDVLKTRLSGAAGNETVDTVGDMHAMSKDGDEAMARTYAKFFGSLFPYLETEKALDFNRCVTYRTHDQRFSGTSLVDKQIGEGDEMSNIVTTVGCFGVGVKFGPALGQAAGAHHFGDELEEGMNVFKSGDPKVLAKEGDKIERAW